MPQPEESPVTHETKLWSVARLQAIENEEQRREQWNQVYRGICQYLPMVEQMKLEPYLFQDCLKEKSTEEAIFTDIGNSEIFAHYDTGHVAAISMLYDIDFVRCSASLLGWAHPLWRSNYRGRKLISTWMHEILDYAFAPIGPEGLGLVKVNAEVATPNYAAYRAMKAVGFREVGVSRLAGLFNNRLLDIVLLEKLNPAAVRAMQEKELSGRQEIEGSITPSVHAASGICGSGTVQRSGDIPGAAALQGTAESGGDGHADLHASGSDATGRERRVDAADVVAIQQPKPDGSRRKARVRK